MRHTPDATRLWLEINRLKGDAKIKQNMLKQLDEDRDRLLADIERLRSIAYDKQAELDA